MICEQCRQVSLNKRAKRFCSNSCRFAFQRLRGLGHGVKSGKMVSCEVCKKEIWRKGYLIKNFGMFFCSRECQGKWNGQNLAANYAGKDSWNWKGGYRDGLGYGFHKQNGKRIQKSRVVAEEKLLRPLETSEVVHHIDGNPKNDNPSNLYLFRHQAAHLRFHLFLRRHNLKGLLQSNLIGQNI